MTDETTARRWNLVIALVATVVWLVLGVLGSGAAMMSPMMFDDAGRAGDPFLWAAFLAIVSFPLVALAAVVAVWVYFRKQNRRRMLWAAAVPSINGVVFALAVVLGGFT